MTYAEFLATVRRNGEYASSDDARLAAQLVLGALGKRLPQATAEHLLDQLPTEIGESLDEIDGPGLTWGVSEFLRHIAEATGEDEEAARGHAEAVLTAVAETVSGGELNKVISGLPAGYAELFGHAELA